MASFDREKIDDHFLDETYTNKTSGKEAEDFRDKILNQSNGAENITFVSSYNTILNSLMEIKSQTVKNSSATEELLKLNNIEKDSTVNKGAPEKMQIQFHPQSTHPEETQSPRGNTESERNINYNFYTDQIPSTSYQDLGFSNVSTNFAIPSISNDAQSQIPTKEKESTSLKCTYCGLVLSSKRWLKRHLASKHDVGKYKCDSCKYVFAYETQLNKHNITYHNVAPSISIDTQNKVPAKEKESTSLKCNFCGIAVSSKLILKFHLASDHAVGSYKCDACKDVFAYEHQLKTHNITCFKKYFK